ncbi:MAG: DUF6580 family putative transport protein [Salibacteraceae bacterium]
MQNNKRIFVLAAIIIVAALTRLIPHPMNFTPLGAMALFGSAYFGRKGLGLLITMIAWMVSDLVLNNLVYASSGGFTLFTEGALYIYGSIVLIYLLGKHVLNKVSIGRMLVGSVSASVIFFIVSNLGVWASGTMYPLSVEGLVACYAAAIPFFQNTLAGDLAYAGLLFFLYERFLKSQMITDRLRS